MIWALHGAFGDPGDWKPLAVALGIEWLQEADVGVRRTAIAAGRVRSQAVGKTPSSGTLVAVDLWAEEHALPFRAWAARFDRQVGSVDPAPLLLAYSMGARLGLHALLESPSRWRGAVLVAPHPGLPDPAERAARRARDDAWLERFDRLEWEAFWREWSDQPILRSRSRRPAPAHRPAKRRALGIWSLAGQEDLRPRLGAIRCPVLWVTGARDEKFSAPAADLVGSIPGGVHRVVEDAGHRVPWEAPEAFAALVKRFVREHATGVSG